MKGDSYMGNIPSDQVLDKMEHLLNIASDFTRLKILYAINGEEKNVSQIVEEVGASQSLVSHQLKVLKKAKLVEVRRAGRQVFYLLADHHVTELLNVVYNHVTE